VSYEHVPEVAAFHFDSDDGQLRHLQTLPTVPADYGEVVRPSDIKIHPNGNFIYTANRGHDSIAIHRINELTGMMEEVAIVPGGGAGPRGMTFDPSGNYLYVANQGSNEINTFSVDAETGLMTNTGQTAEVLKPACIKFLQA
jgi:6-phosphogluconolactonase